MRDQFLFYRSYYEALKSLPKEDQADILMAIAGYALDESEPELDGVSAAIFTLVKPTLDAAAKKSAGGAKGKKKDTDKISERYTEDVGKIDERYAEDTGKSGETIKDKGYKDKGYKDKGDVIIKETSRARVCESTDWVDEPSGLDVPSICQSVCDEFNRLTNSRYSPQARYITDPVIELLKQGYTEADMLTVIGKKYREWSPTEMRGNIKPMTVLNAKKFGEYLAQPEIGPPKSKQRRQMEEMAAAIRNPFESEVMQIDSG